MLRDLWTGSFDVRSIVLPTSGNVGGLAHLDPLIRPVQGHVLGRIPKDALVTESTERYPDVLEGRAMSADRLIGI